MTTRREFLGTAASAAGALAVGALGNVAAATPEPPPPQALPTPA